MHSRAAWSPRPGGAAFPWASRGRWVEPVITASRKPTEDVDDRRCRGSKPNSAARRDALTERARYLVREIAECTVIYQEIVIA
jgi:hypothetical protein